MTTKTKQTTIRYNALTHITYIRIHAAESAITAEKQTKLLSKQTKTIFKYSNIYRYVCAAALDALGDFFS